MRNMNEEQLKKWKEFTDSLDPVQKEFMDRIIYGTWEQFREGVADHLLPSDDDEGSGYDESMAFLSNM